MDEPDVSYGVSHLLNKFIAVQVHGSDSAQAKARLKRTAFTFLLGLDRNEEVKHVNQFTVLFLMVTQRSAVHIMGRKSTNLQDI